jgi:hypothetical protein
MPKALTLMMSTVRLFPRISVSSALGQGGFSLVGASLPCMPNVTLAVKARCGPCVGLSAFSLPKLNKESDRCRLLGSQRHRPILFYVSQRQVQLLAQRIFTRK